MTHFQTLPSCSLYSLSFKIKLWQSELRLIQSSILGWFKEGYLPLGAFFGRTIVYMMMQSLIAWLNECSWHQLSTIPSPKPPPVSVLGHSWPTFSLFLPVHSSLCHEQSFLFRPVSKTPRGVNNCRVTLIYIYRVAGYSLETLPALPARWKMSLHKSKCANSNWLYDV